jgi:hypothetical protein
MTTMSAWEALSPCSTSSLTKWIDNENLPVAFLSKYYTGCRHKRHRIALQATLSQPVRAAYPSACDENGHGVSCVPGRDGVQLS